MTEVQNVNSSDTAIGVRSNDIAKNDNASKNDNKREKKHEKDDRNFSKNVNEFFKRGSCLLLFLVAAAISTAFPIFSISALGFLFRATLPDKVIEDSLNNKNGIVKGLARLFFASTFIEAVKHGKKLVTNGQIKINSKEGVVKDIIETKLGNKSSKLKKTNSKEVTSNTVSGNNKPENKNNIAGNFGPIHSNNADKLAKRRSQDSYSIGNNPGLN